MLPVYGAEHATSMTDHAKVRAGCNGAIGMKIDGIC